MASSKFPTRLYSSASFLESAGCILFDFRGTGFDPLSLPSTSQTSTTIKLQCEPKVVLFYSNPRQEYLLPKGRRNISESRKDTAVRETFEEVGLRCSLLPVTLNTRATSVNPADDRLTKDGYTVDEPRTFHRVTDPFMCALRQTHGRLGRSHVAADGSIARQASEFDPYPGGNTDPTQFNAARGMAEGSEVMKFIWWFVGVVHEEQGTAEEIASRELEPGCDVVSVSMNEAVARCSFKDDAQVVQRAIDVIKQTFNFHIA